MNRKQLLNFCKEKIFPQLAPTAEVDTLEVVKIVSRWRLGRSLYVAMVPVVRDGVLYMNGEALARIAPKDPRPAWTARGYAMEGKILAQQEMD